MQRAQPKSRDDDMYERHVIITVESQEGWYGFYPDKYCREGENFSLPFRFLGWEIDIRLTGEKHI